MPGGYGWVFPKGDHANLGVGGWMSEGPLLRTHLDRLAKAHGVEPSAVESVRGHRLPMRELGAPAARGRVLLVGDAAGLVDPLSGDGMYEAFVSAKLASEAILAGTPEEYEPALSAALDRHAASSWKAKRAADRYPRACLWALRAPGVFNTVAGLLQGRSRTRATDAASPAPPCVGSPGSPAPPRPSEGAQACAWSKVEASRASTLPTTPFVTACTTTVTFFSARPPVGVAVTMYVSTR